MLSNKVAAARLTNQAAEVDVVGLLRKIWPSEEPHTRPLLRYEIYTDLIMPPFRMPL